MIEYVESFHAELRLHSFPEFEALAERQVDVLETGIAEDVAAHVAKSVKSIGDQHRIANHVAVVGWLNIGGESGSSPIEGSQCGRANTSGSGEAGLRDGARASNIARTKTRNPIGTDGLEVGWVAKEIPAVGGFAGCAEIKRLIIDIPRLATLEADDGIDLPTLE